MTNSHTVSVHSDFWQEKTITPWLDYNDLWLNYNDLKWGLLYVFHSVGHFIFCHILSVWYHFVQNWYQPMIFVHIPQCHMQQLIPMWLVVLTGQRYCVEKSKSISYQISCWTKPATNLFCLIQKSFVMGF